MEACQSPHMLLGKMPTRSERDDFLYNSGIYFPFLSVRTWMGLLRNLLAHLSESRLPHRVWGSCWLVSFDESASFDNHFFQYVVLFALGCGLSPAAWSSSGSCLRAACTSPFLSVPVACSASARFSSLQDFWARDEMIA